MSILAIILFALALILMGISLLWDTPKTDRGSLFCFILAVALSFGFHL